MLFHCEDVSLPGLEYDKIKQWINEVLESENLVEEEINVIFTSDKFLSDLNKKFLDKNYYTDVISFNYSDDEDIKGDIYISSERVKDNADVYEEKEENEFLRVILHGVLHLIGYDDQLVDGKTNMTKKENEYLKVYDSRV